MEVHPRYGRVAAVLGTLAAHGFTCTALDGRFDRVSDPEAADFLYAWRPTGRASSGDPPDSPR
jgi:hypothetical protein